MIKRSVRMRSAFRAQNLRTLSTLQGAEFQTDAILCTALQPSLSENV